MRKSYRKRSRKVLRGGAPDYKGIGLIVAAVLGVLGASAFIIKKMNEGKPGTGAGFSNPAHEDALNQPDSSDDKEEPGPTIYGERRAAAIREYQKTVKKLYDDADLREKKAPRKKLSAKDKREKMVMLRFRLQVEKVVKDVNLSPDGLEAVKEARKLDSENKYEEAWRAYKHILDELDKDQKEEEEQLRQQEQQESEDEAAAAAAETEVKKKSGAFHSNPLVEADKERLTNAINNENIDEIKRLLEKLRVLGFRAKDVIDTLKIEGSPAFIVAAGAEKAEDIIPILIDYGADINIKDDKGNTALNLAIAKNHQKIIELLWGADAAADDV